MSTHEAGFQSFFRFFASFCPNLVRVKGKVVLGAPAFENRGQLLL